MILGLLLALPVMASQKAGLNLWKFSEFLYGRCGWCGEFVTLREGENLSSMTDFELYDQDGYYSVTFEGSSGATITLFGASDF